MIQAERIRRLKKRLRQVRKRAAQEVLEERQRADRIAADWYAAAKERDAARRLLAEARAERDLWFRTASSRPSTEEIRGEFARLREFHAELRSTVDTLEKCVRPEPLRRMKTRKA